MNQKHFVYHTSSELNLRYSLAVTITGCNVTTTKCYLAIDESM